MKRRPEKMEWWLRPVSASETQMKTFEESLAERER